MRRDAYRPADVGAEVAAAQAGRDRGGRTARRAADAPAEVPRIVRRAEQLVVRLRFGVAPPRHVGLAHDDRARGPQRRDRRCVLRRDVIAQFHSPARAAHPGDRDRVLDRHRDARQRTDVVAPGEPLVDGRGVSCGAIEIERDDGVDCGVQPFDACGVELQQRVRRDSRARTARRLPRRRPKGNVVGEHTAHLSSRGPRRVI